MFNEDFCVNLLLQTKQRSEKDKSLVCTNQCHKLSYKVFLPNELANEFLNKVCGKRKLDIQDIEKVVLGLEKRIEKDTQLKFEHEFITERRFSKNFQVFAGFFRYFFCKTTKIF